MPASTGYGDPVQKLFKFDDGERMVGALSLDARLAQPGEARRGDASTALGLRFALDAAPEVSTRAGRRYAKTGEGDEIIGVQPVRRRRICSSSLTAMTNALVCKVDEVNVLAGPGKGVMVIKVDDGDRVVGLPRGATEPEGRGIEFETQKGRKLRLQPREVRGDGAAAARATRCRASATR